MKIFKAILFLLTLLSFVSCSVEKRHYMSGYNINFKNNRHTKTEITKVNTTETFESHEYPVTSSMDNTVYLSSKSATVKNLRDTCDLIIMKDSSKIIVKIIEIGASEVKIRACDTPSDSSITINKSEIAGINFSNGLKGEFDSTGKLKPKKEVNAPLTKEAKIKQMQKIDPHKKSNIVLILGIIAFILLLLAFSSYFLLFPFEFFIICISLATTAGMVGLTESIKLLRYIRYNPGNDVYKKKAQLALILNIISLLPILVGAVYLVSGILQWFGLI